MFLKILPFTSLTIALMLLMPNNLLCFRLRSCLPLNGCYCSFMPYCTYVSHHLRDTFFILIRYFPPAISQNNKPLSLAFPQYFQTSVAKSVLFSRCVFCLLYQLHSTDENFSIPISALSSKYSKWLHNQELFRKDLLMAS